MAKPDARTTERVQFRLLCMPCCGMLLCWVNSRMSTYCPECRSSVLREIRECVMVRDDTAQLRYDGDLLNLTKVRATEARIVDFTGASKVEIDQIFEFNEDFEHADALFGVWLPTLARYTPIAYRNGVFEWSWVNVTSSCQTLHEAAKAALEEAQ